MTLIRAAGRTMLASFFVVNGAKAAAKPEAMVADADPIARKVVPLVQRVAPPSVANYVPEDTKTLVRITGVGQLLGGLGLATGMGRRLSAGVLSATMVPHVLASRPSRGATAEQKAAARSVMLRNIALLGAAMIASQDTQGKPSIAWRANAQARQLSREAQQQKKSIAKAAKKQGRQLGLTSSPATKQTRKAKKAARKAQAQASKQVGSISQGIEQLLS